MITCPSCGEDNPERAKFCLECGTALAQNKEVPQQARKTVTVLFSDMTGSTALAERVDPESVRAAMERYFTEMRAILERHGETVEKFIGDAVMAVFGIPIAHEDDALRAVRAAVHMRASLASLNEHLSARWGVALEFRTGINTGEVIAGGPSQRQSFAMGEAVNVAARLEQQAAPGEILLGNDTYRLVRDGVVAEAVGAVAARGKSEKVEAWRLKDVLASSQVSRRLHSALVGRAPELAHLLSAFDDVVQTSSCRIVTLLGAAGVGKSRLIAEFTQSLESAFVIRGRSVPYGIMRHRRDDVTIRRQSAPLVLMKSL
jgi:class 3 adenylate cyclase